MTQHKTPQKPFTVAIYGASGFLGQHVMQHILRTTNYTIKAVSRHPETISVDSKYANRVQLIAADIFNYDDIYASLAEVDAAMYLIHMMAMKGDYYAHESKAAKIFGRAVQDAGVRRVVYMSGLGNDKDKLSRHLASRHHTGKIIKKYAPETLELRASMIVGDGSAAYDIMRKFVHELWFQPIPNFAVTPTQPITADDAAAYLTRALAVGIDHSEIIDIGGPEILTYKDLISRYATRVGKKPRIIVIPFIPIWLGAQFLNLFAPKHHAKIGRQMAESLKYPMVVVNNNAALLFPDIVPESVERVFD